MHEGSNRLARLDRCCFYRRFQGVKDDVVVVRSGDDGFSSKALQSEDQEFVPGFADNLPLHNAPSEIASLRTQTSVSSLAALLQTFGDNACLSDGRQAHALLIEDGLEQHPSLQNPLFQLYAKCRAMDDAEKLFAGMHGLSLVSWNVMISSYLREGWEEKASQLFERLQQHGLTPTKVTYICMLSTCVDDKKLFTGKTIHACLLTSQFQDSAVVYTALLNMYGRCGSIEDVCQTFNGIKDRDVIAWNAMVEVYHEHGLYEESVVLFSQMQVEGVIPNRITLVSMLHAFTHLGALFEGRLLHRFAIDAGFILEVSVVTAITSMYGRCGNLEEAILLFKHFCKRDTVLWNAMIALYSLHGRCRDALELLNQMLHEGFLASRITYTSIFNACAIQAAVFTGKCIHACIINSEMEMDLDIVNSIVNMYGKFGNIENANYTFQNLPERDVVTWSVMIAAYAKVGQCKDAFRAFHEMQERGITPNVVTIVNILRAFETEADIDEFKEIHDYVLSHGLNEDVMVGTALINAYGKCGNIEGAQMVFGELPKHDLLCWTAMISSCVENGQVKEALLLFDQMKKEGIVPDTVAVANILVACSDIEDASECERMHDFIQLQGIELDEVVGSAMLSTYGRYGRLSLSEALFENLPKEQAIAWNAMMVVYIQHGQSKRALELFYQMCSSGIKPDKDSFVSSLTACANETSLIAGEKVHTLLCNSGFVLNEVVGAALVNMYGKCGHHDLANGVFDQMQRHGLILWNAIVGVHAQYGESIMALRAIQDMCNHGCMPDVISSISVLSACSHSGLIDEGLCFVASMEYAYSIFPLIDHYICVADMLGRSGRSTETEILINHMPFQPKAVLYMSLLGACQSLASIYQGKRAAKCMSELASENAGPYVSLSNIFALQVPEKGPMRQ